MIDAHCHLDDEQFANDRDAVLARAMDAGVAAIITAGTDVATSRAAVALAEQYASVYAVVGIHPQAAHTCDAESLATIRTLAQHPKVVGIGEIGLDFYWQQNPPREIQERAFIAQLELAAELDKPVVIHDRDAHAELMATLAKVVKPSQGGILHCFSGDLAMAQQAIALGYAISFAGNLTFKNATRLQEIARALPLDKIVIETDAPYLSPLRGQRNESANVARVAAKLAELKNLTLDVAQQSTSRNSEMLFRLKTAG
ncbi:MAG: TatD family hydrolase [Chloroflexi bacterium]|nr:TatD family hydrolase [Chloroflexota bacterium]